MSNNNDHDETTSSTKPTDNNTPYKSISISPPLHPVVTRKRGPSISNKTFAVSPLNSSDSLDLSDSSTYESDYAGSAGSSSDEFVPLEYLLDTMKTALDSSILDRGIVQQVQTSALINAKTREISALQSDLNARLMELHQTSKSGIKNLKSLRQTLSTSQRRILKLKEKVRANYPIEYAKAKDKVIYREFDDDDEYD